MTTEIILAVLLLVSMLGGAISLYFVQTSADRRQAALLAELSELRSDNRALTEALVRAEGKPLIFRRVEPIPSAGWFDQAQTTTELAEGIKSK